MGILQSSNPHPDVFFTDIGFVPGFLSGSAFLSNSRNVSTSGGFGMLVGARQIS